jgi:hypothetical protein
VANYNYARRQVLVVPPPSQQNTNNNKSKSNDEDYIKIVQDNNRNYEDKQNADNENKSKAPRREVKLDIFHSKVTFYDNHNKKDEDPSKNMDYGIPSATTTAPSASNYVDNRSASGGKMKNKKDDGSGNEMDKSSFEYYYKQVQAAKNKKLSDEKDNEDSTLLEESFNLFTQDEENIVRKAYKVRCFFFI